MSVNMTHEIENDTFAEDVYVRSMTIMLHYGISLGIRNSAELNKSVNLEEINSTELKIIADGIVTGIIKEKKLIDIIDKSMEIANKETKNES